MQRFVMLLTFLCVSLVYAWLPADKNLFPRHQLNGLGSAGGSQTARDAARRQRRYLLTPSTAKIRGVNLGSLFIIEPWMAHIEWVNMGCAGYVAESDCVQAMGQANASQAWANHWNTWITLADLQLMRSYGLNTIRIPVGWWINEELVEPGEFFPQGGFAFLERLCEWAAEVGLYIILDLHALPGSQQVNTSFTGIFTEVAGFYQIPQYNRAWNFLNWLTNVIHTNTAFRNVGMLEVANEPMPMQPTLITDYYPNAYANIRIAEAALNVLPEQQLTVLLMDQYWGAGNPVGGIPGLSTTLNVAFDDHYYLSKSNETPSQDAYIAHTCQKQYATDNMPLLTGEWSLAVNNSVTPFYIDPTNDVDTFYRTYWAAQVQLFEKNMGWIFWSWKTNLAGYQWDYQKAVKAGIIAQDPADAFEINACNAV